MTIRIRPIRYAALVAASFALSAAGIASAAGTEPPPRIPPPVPAQAVPPAEPKADSAQTQAAIRTQAERSYTEGWKLSEDAKKELASGKEDSAKKKFGKALKRFDEATQIDPQYFLAWNMVGFCARKSGDLKRSFAAYAKCLEIEPEYAQAHEYLGEAYLMSGEVPKAKEQLAWLQSRKAAEADQLAPKIEAYAKGGWKEVEKLSAGEKTPTQGW